MTMLEKAARALCVLRVVNPDSFPPSSGGTLAWEDEIEAVRAVLTAIREPDEAMLEAAIAPYRYNNTPEFNAAYKRTVAGYMSAMIDAILAEKP